VWKTPEQEPKLSWKHVAVLTRAASRVHRHPDQQQTAVNHVKWLWNSCRGMTSASTGVCVRSGRCWDNRERIHVGSLYQSTWDILSYQRLTDFGEALLDAWSRLSKVSCRCLTSTLTFWKIGLCHFNLVIEKII